MYRYVASILTDYLYYSCRFVLHTYAKVAYIFIVTLSNCKIYKKTISGEL